jgi:hypothetical protein
MKHFSDIKSEFRHLDTLQDQSSTYERIVTKGSSVIEVYKRDGKVHRNDGPARISLSANGTIIEDYYKDGKRHRDDGPASIMHTSSVELYEFYYINGHSYGPTAPTAERVQEVEAWEAVKHAREPVRRHEEIPAPRREQPQQPPFKFIWSIS